jgi:hypothetical protein
MCVRRDQQREGVDFNASDIYLPVLKAPEARLLAAIAAEHESTKKKTRLTEHLITPDNVLS